MPPGKGMGRRSGFAAGTSRVGRFAAGILAGILQIARRIAFSALTRLLLAPVQIGAQCRGQPLLALRLAVVHRFLANTFAPAV